MIIHLLVLFICGEIFWLRTCHLTYRKGVADEGRGVFLIARRPKLFLYTHFSTLRKCFYFALIYLDVAKSLPPYCDIVALTLSRLVKFLYSAKIDCVFHQRLRVVLIQPRWMLWPWGYASMAVQSFVSCCWAWRNECAHLERMWTDFVLGFV